MQSVFPKHTGKPWSAPNYYPTAGIDLPLVAQTGPSKMADGSCKRTVVKRSAHDVEILPSGIVVKIAREPLNNAKLIREMRAIDALHTKFPDSIVPILSRGEILGRRYYMMERQQGRSLSEIVFSQDVSLVEKCSTVEQALQFVVDLVTRERSHLTVSALRYQDILKRESDEIRAQVRGDMLLRTRFVIEETEMAYTIGELLNYYLVTVSDIPVKQAPVSHQNYHFGNIIQLDNGRGFRLIDPDTSLPAIDPLFGLARFAFSYWHELATEHSTLVQRTATQDSLILSLPNRCYRQLVSAVPELMQTRVFENLFSPYDICLFHALLFYCFIRSVRINWEDSTLSDRFSDHDVTAQEIISAGCLTFFGSVGLSSL
ncbi:hypothetical protein DC522_29790 [Microvirga sp. KLBC 81]|uniref:hypothetical protein n=1 Tax=Microvirga sp. KLBC 81 TaxID=1862707 RepID=UPI000D50DBBF|nr:hypothetical protein [Microvirga sp. KLBC 81]PVE20868.1 hypothetical protein DC522_29790 [Microvirga sp. KLBC 81]